LIDEEFFTSQKTKERMSRERIGKPKHLADRPQPTQEERNSINFAKRAQEKGFFTDDLTYWNKLNSLYESLGRELSFSFYDRLRLEVFHRAIEQAKEGDIALLNSYTEIGRSVDPEWFKLLAEEEGFIKAKLLTFWADGEDEKGFFKLNASGGKTRQLESYVYGEGCVYMNSQMALGKLVKKALQKSPQPSAKGKSRR
jgi:hypothetical protein